MKIRVIWVGKAKEGFIREGIEKYKRLIVPFCEIEFVEIPDSREKNTERAMQKEGERIVKIAPRFVLLNEKGKELTSVQFTGFLQRSNITDFVIGGPYGVSETVTKKASDVLSLSKMTFTHEMSRIIFLEQIYRACTIMNKRGYHH